MQAVETARHEYRLARSQGGVLLVVGVVLIAAIVPIGWAAWTDTTLSSAAMILTVGAGMLGVGAYLLAWTTRARLTLDKPGLSLRGAFSERHYAMSDVEGMRNLPRKYGTMPVIWVRGGDPIDVSRFATDDAFRSWFDALPDLDERDRKALLDEIVQSEELGATPDERMNALGRAKGWSYALTGATIAAMAGMLWEPEKFRLPCAAVLWLAPVAAMMLLHRSHLLYTVFRPKKDPRADLTAPLMLAGFGLMTASQGMNIVSWQPLMLGMIPVAVGFVAAFYHPVRSNVQQAGAVIALFFIALLYGFGAVVSADTLGDGSAPAIYRVRVLDKYITVTHGKGAHTTYYLRTEPWGPFAEPVHSVSVPSSVYRTTSEGDLVCIGLRAGLLHAAWYERMPCEDAVDVPQ
jgi:hypothetical protein